MKLIKTSKENETRVSINLYEHKLENSQMVSQRSWFCIGNLARISIKRGAFIKRYLEGCSEELFVIKQVVGNNPTNYKISMEKI